MKEILQIRYFRLVVLHLGIAFLIYVQESLSAIYFFAAFGYFLFQVFDKKNRNNEALMAAAYIAGAEVYWRQTGALVFYETGKYAVILFLIIGMYFKGTSARTAPYWTYLLILIPGIIVASVTLNYQADFRRLIAFNLSGPVCLGVVAVYCYYKKIQQKDMQKVVMMLLLPLISQMFYLYFYTPTLREEIISLSGNYAATGGFGPNQISTVFGLGAFLIITRLFTVKNYLINLVDLALLGLMGYRAIVTFSRGGVFTAIICTIVFIALLYYKKNNREQEKIRFKIILVTATAAAVWLFSSTVTSGLIGNRYANENESGESKGDISTGRVELVATELEGFYRNPVIGIGVGKGREFREEHLGVEINTHNEVSRLLAEHGMLGVIAILILIFVPVLFWLKFQNNYYFLAFLAFWFATINHSAMRIALPALVYGLALLYIVDDKKQPVKKKKLAKRLAL